MACPLWRDLLSSMQAMVRGESNSSVATFRFAHAETLIPLYTLLGLFHDPYPLYADSWSDRVRDRVFKSSHISPFAANLALVLYQCDTAWVVSVLINETQTRLPGCSSVYCPYDEFMALYEPLSLCDFNTLCKVQV